MPETANPEHSGSGFWIPLPAMEPRNKSRCSRKHSGSGGPALDLERKELHAFVSCNMTAFTSTQSYTVTTVPFISVDVAGLYVCLLAAQPVSTMIQNRAIWQIAQCLFIT